MDSEGSHRDPEKPGEVAVLRSNIPTLVDDGAQASLRPHSPMAYCDPSVFQRDELDVDVSGNKCKLESTSKDNKDCRVT